MKLKVVIIMLVSLTLPLPVFAQGKNRVGGGDITFTPKGTTAVIFSHELHVSQKGIKCNACHQTSQVAQGIYKMDMAKITKDDFCGKCHNGQKSFDVGDKKNCIRCHKQ